MAYNTTVTDFDVHPVTNEDGTLGGIKVTQTTRTVRKSESGSVLDYGYGTSEEVSEIEIPLHKLSAVVGEMASWPIYFASGEAARDSAKPVNWPNSVSTVEQVNV